MQKRRVLGHRDGCRLRPQGANGRGESGLPGPELTLVGRVLAQAAERETASIPDEEHAPLGAVLGLGSKTPAAVDLDDVDQEDLRAGVTHHCVKKVPAPGALTNAAHARACGRKPYPPCCVLPIRPEVG